MADSETPLCKVSTKGMLSRMAPCARAWRDRLHAAAMREKRTHEGTLSRYTSLERNSPQNLANCSNAPKPWVAQAARQAVLMAPAEVPTST